MKRERLPRCRWTPTTPGGGARVGPEGLLEHVLRHAGLYLLLGQHERGGQAGQRPGPVRLRLGLPHRRGDPVRLLRRAGLHRLPHRAEYGPAVPPDLRGQGLLSVLRHPGLHPDRLVRGGRSHVLHPRRRADGGQRVGPHHPGRPADDGHRRHRHEGPGDRQLYLRPPHRRAGGLLHGHRHQRRGRAGRHLCPVRRGHLPGHPASAM